MSLKGTSSAKNLLRGSINSLKTLTINAYGIAVQNGFEGTQEEWLASLKGEKGDTPYIGENGNWWIANVDTGTPADRPPLEVSFYEGTSNHTADEIMEHWWAGSEIRAVDSDRNHYVFDRHYYDVDTDEQLVYFKRIEVADSEVLQKTACVNSAGNVTYEYATCETETFVVKVKHDPLKDTNTKFDSATIDKTAAEIEAAYKSGKNVICEFTTDGMRMVLQPVCIINMMAAFSGMYQHVVTAVKLYGDVLEIVETEYTTKEEFEEIISVIAGAFEGMLSKDELDTAINTALAQAKASGQFDGEPGKDGADGQPGKDGADGKDYVLTDADKQEIAEQAAGLVEVPEGSGGGETVIVTIDGSTMEPSHTSEEIYALFLSGANVVLQRDREIYTLQEANEGLARFVNLYTSDSRVYAYHVLIRFNYVEEMVEKSLTPSTLTFTGAVSATYDGSSPVSVEIPQGGGGEESEWEILADITTEEDVAVITVDLPENCNELFVKAHGFYIAGGSGYSGIKINNTGVNNYGAVAECDKWFYNNNERYAYCHLTRVRELLVSRFNNATFMQTPYARAANQPDAIGVWENFGTDTKWDTVSIAAYQSQFLAGFHFVVYWR